MDKKVNGHWIPNFLRDDKLRRYRLNGEQIGIAKNFLVLIYGEACANCGRPPHENNPLQIDHVDGNYKRSYWKNLQLLCRKCNNAKKGSEQIRSLETKKFSVSMGIAKIDMPASISSSNAETFLKGQYLPKLMDFILMDSKLLQQQYNYKTFINDAAIYCGFASQITIKRYLDALCSERFGIFERVMDPATKIEYLKLNDKIKDLPHDELRAYIERIYHW